jgi:hypothetical protein
MGGGPAQASKAVTVRNITDTGDATVYTSTAGTSTGSNPITTDASGTFTAYLAAGRYLLKDAAGDKLEITVGAPGTDTAAPPAVTGARGGTAISSPTAPGSSYAQAEAASGKAAIDALIAANVAQAATITNLLTVLAAAGIITNSTTT